MGTADEKPPPGARDAERDGDRDADRDGSPTAHSDGSRRGVALTTIAALGVVFGDIGTSPLYAVNACFDSSFALDPELQIHPTPENVLGVISCIFWALTFVIGFKYALFILRADDDGEGGIFALLGLLARGRDGERRRLRPGVLLTVGIIGAALLYGDGVITPAISVLSALEGLEVASPELEVIIVPLACVILIALFAAQRFGVQGMAWIFGPIMLIWFVTIGTLGVLAVIEHPAILAAVNPYHAAQFFLLQPLPAFVALGAVVLCVTGGEALYADLGHFHRTPIRIAWYAIVWPGLLCSYFGQGALLLAHPKDVAHPFFSLVPAWMTIPMVVLASLAAVIASQAIITGVFSLTRQGTQLGLLPRFLVVHLSKKIEGRVFLPQVNGMMLLMTLIVVLMFRSSVELAGAYGIAVTAVMVTTSFIFGAVMRRVWGWSWFVVIPLVTAFLAVDLAFFSANAIKIFSNGWFPVIVAVAVGAVMATWSSGRRFIHDTIDSALVSTADFVKRVQEENPPRVPGTAVFLTDDPERVPGALSKLYCHLPVLNEQVVVLSMVTEPRAHVPRRDQLSVEQGPAGFWTITGRHGFAQVPHVPRIVTLAFKEGLTLDFETTTYFLKREIIVFGGESPMMYWRKRLFSNLSRNSMSAGTFFQLRAERVIEIGMRVKI